MKYKIIFITDEDAKPANPRDLGIYTSLSSCLLARASKRQYPEADIAARRWGIIYNRERYKFTNPADAEKIRQCYDSKGINLKEGFTPFSVQLVRVEIDDKENFFKF